MKGLGKADISFGSVKGQKGLTDAFCVYEIEKKDFWFRDSLGVKAVKRDAVF